MNHLLSEYEFTAHAVAQLGRYEQLDISAPEPLTIAVGYGVSEPVLTLKLGEAYEEYKRNAADLDVILQPLITEVGWTANARRYSFSDISEHTLPLMRDLKRQPFAEVEINPDPEHSKGPLVYQELVNRPEERVVMQLVLAKNELIQSLYMGDALRSCPEPTQLTAFAVHNLRRRILETGLTLSEYRIENFTSSPWLVGIRQGRFRQFLASLITVPEVMSTLQKTINAADGIIAILPSQEQLLICAQTDETTIAQMGLLAQHLKDQCPDPVSGFIWHFQEGILKRVQTIDSDNSSSV